MLAQLDLEYAIDRLENNRDLFVHPDKIKGIPDQSEVEFIEKDFEERQIEGAKNKFLVKVKHTIEVLENSKI